MSFHVNFLNSLRCWLFRSLEIVTDKIGVTLEELIIRQLPFEVFEDQVHGESLRAARFSSDYERYLVQNTSDYHKHILFERVVLAYTLL